MFAVDIGACQGVFIDKMLELKIGVLAIEPNPALYKDLKEKYRDKEVLLINAAAWNNNDGARLYYHKNGDVMGSSLYTEKSNVNPDKYVDVETINIGESLAKADKDIDILKIDAEGAEYVILQSILDHFDPRRIRHYLVEDHERKITDSVWRKKREQVRKKYEDLGIELHPW